MKRFILAVAALFMTSAAMAQSYTPSAGVPQVGTTGQLYNGGFYSCYQINFAGTERCMAGGAGISQTLMGDDAGLPTTNAWAAGIVCVGGAACGAQQDVAFLASGSLAAVSLVTLKTYSGTLIVTVDGVVNTSANIDLTGASSFTNAATIIAAAFTAPNFTVAWDANNSEFVIKSNTASFGGSLSYGSGTIADSLLLSLSSGAQLALTGGSVGIYNTCGGYQCLSKITTASNNTIFGASGGNTITTGTGNTLVGYYTQAYTTGSHNIEIASDNVLSFGGATASNEVNIGNTYVNSQTAPTIASGFGTSPSITANAGSHVIVVQVGTGGTANSGVITLPTSPKGTGWTCTIYDQTTTSAAVTTTKQTANTTTSSTWSQFSDLSVATAWVAGDKLIGTCEAY